MRVLTASEIEKVWNQSYAKEKLKVPFLEFRWHKNWFETLGKDYEQFTLISEAGGLVPFAKRGNEILFSGGDEVADYLDIIGASKSKIDTWKETLSFLKTSEMSQLNLQNIPQSSPTVDFFKTNFPQTIQEEDTTPIINLPSTWDEYLLMLDRKSRHELRRKIRKFEAEHPNFEIVLSNDLETNTAELFRLMHLDPDKHQFLTSNMEKFLRSILSEFKTNLYFPLLKNNDQTVACVVAFTSGEELLLYNSGFDEKQFSGASFYLKTKTVQYAIQKHFKKFNFLQGSERYKYELGGQDFGVYKVELKL